MAQQARDLVGTTLAERYQVLRELGRGAMGTVYEARHAVIGRRLAIKVLKTGYASAAQRERFFHEARAAGAITHQHIVQVHDFGLVSTGEPYIVMEYVDGTALQTHMESVGPMPPEQCVEIAAQVLSALEVIHGAGLVHRDIKPANIMLARGHRPRLFTKLLDFGIARAINPAWHRPDLTRVDQVLGTPAYLSPEQVAGGATDPRWDLWAMGTILYEMLSAKLPFRLESLEQVADDILHCRLIPLRQRRPQLPPWLLEVVERAHHPVLDLRFPTATGFLQALEQQNAHADGEEGDLRTVPFTRVELDTPPPELIAKLSPTERGTPPRGTAAGVGGRAIRTPSDPPGRRSPSPVSRIASPGDELVVVRPQDSLFASSDNDHGRKPSAREQEELLAAMHLPGERRAGGDDSLTRPVTRSSQDDVPLPSPASGQIVSGTTLVPRPGRHLLYLLIALLGLAALGLATYILVTQ